MIASTSPLRSARRVSSASSSRTCRSRMRPSRSPRASDGMLVLLQLGRKRMADNIQPEQHLLFVRQVPDHLAQREWQFLDKRRDDDNLFRHDLLRMLINVDHLEIVAALQIGLANGADVLDGASGPGGGSGYEKPQAVLHPRFCAQRVFEYFG